MTLTNSKFLPYKSIQDFEKHKFAELYQCSQHWVIAKIINLHCNKYFVTKVFLGYFASMNVNSLIQFQQKYLHSVMITNSSIKMHYLFHCLFLFLVLKKQYFHHSLLNIHQIYPSFQMCSVLSPPYIRSRFGTEVEYQTLDQRVCGSTPGLSSPLFFFFTFWQWKSMKIHQIFDEFPSWICRIFIKWILKILLIWWNFNIYLMKFLQILMKVHQIQIKLHQT